VTVSPPADPARHGCSVERDRDRAAVYAAEAAAFAGTDLEQVRPIADVLGLIELVSETDWWPASIVVTARPARSDARSSSTRPGEIRIARPQATIATAAHELGHALAGVGAGHGPRYRAAVLDCVQMMTNVPLDVAARAGRSGGVPGLRRGTVHVAQLTAAFDAFGVPAGARDWAPPPWRGTIAL
jgi:hypothetical protein